MFHSVWLSRHRHSHCVFFSSPPVFLCFFLFSVLFYSYPPYQRYTTQRLEGTTADRKSWRKKKDYQKKYQVHCGITLNKMAASLRLVCRRFVIRNNFRSVAVLHSSVRNFATPDKVTHTGQVTSVVLVFQGRKRQRIVIFKIFDI